MTYDIAIVGAGPAGAWAGFTLARQGARVAIIDGSHPREKPCGGGVTGRALALVADAVDAAALPASPIRRARFIDRAAGRSAIVPLDDAAAEGLPPLVVASRVVFDAALLGAARRAGATLLDARVAGVAMEGSAARIDTTAGVVRAGFLIGADGANSLVRRRLARPFRRDELSIATGYFAHGVTSDEIVVELAADPPGYFWSFPRPSHLAVGVCAPADAGQTAAALRARAAAWMRDANLGALSRLEPYSWPIPSLDVRSLRSLDLAGPRWCLAGDAAGLVDPITREGIYFALLSGQWAAEAAIGDASRYEARVRAAIVPELMRAARLKAGFFQPAVASLLVRALRHSPAVGAVMARLIAGRQDYASLRWQLLKTFEWGLAWEALVTAKRTPRAPAPGRRCGTP